MRLRVLVALGAGLVLVGGTAGVAAADAWIPSPPACLNTLNVYDLHYGSDDTHPQLLVAALKWHNCVAGDPAYTHDIIVRISYNGVPSSVVHAVPQGEPGDHVASVSWTAGAADFGAVVVTASATWPNSDEGTTVTNTHPFSLRPLDG